MDFKYATSNLTGPAIAMHKTLNIKADPLNIMFTQEIVFYIMYEGEEAAMEIAARYQQKYKVKTERMIRDMLIELRVPSLTPLPFSFEFIPKTCAFIAKHMIIASSYNLDFHYPGLYDELERFFRYIMEYNHHVWRGIEYKYRIQKIKRRQA